MSMYGTYLGFNLPLSTSAALVASRPRVWPLASTTYHLRSISLPLGTKVLISLLPSKNAKTAAQSALPMASAHGKNFPPTSKQSCSGEDCGVCPPRGSRLCGKFFPVPQKAPVRSNPNQESDRL